MANAPRSMRHLQHGLARSPPPTSLVMCERVLEFHRANPRLTVVDVRSPGEFASGSVPGAFNLPVLDDGERAQVGKLYKNAGSSAAVELGLSLFAPKEQLYFNAFEQLRQQRGREDPLLVLCARGGLRSASVASWLASRGMENLYVVKGGFKAYRREVAQKLEELGTANLLVVHGPSGSGKSELIRTLSTRKAAPVIDFEALARHRGSVFGGMVQPVKQPSTVQFENELAHAFSQVQDSPRILVEFEDRLGALVLPTPVRENVLRKSPFVFVSRSFEARARRIEETYALKSPSDVDFFLEKLSQLKKYLSNDLKAQLTSAAHQGDFLFCARALLLHHYDIMYAKLLRLHRGKMVAEFDLDLENEKAIEWIEERLR